MALVLALRWRTLGTSYWGDEAIAIGIASHPIGAFAHYLANDGSPPLYYVALHYWMEIFGRSPLATHVLSLAAAMLAVPAAWWSAGRLWGRRAAPMAAALVATCAYLGYYATETRMYSWLVLCAILALTFFVLAYREGGLGYWSAAVVLTAITLYLQYYALYFLGATVVVGVGLALHRRSQRLLKATLAYGLGCLALFAPWAPQFIYQLHHTGAPWAPHPTPVDFFADSINALASAGWAGIVLAIAVGVLGRRRHGRPGPGLTGHQPSGPDGPSALVLATAVPLVTLALAWAAGQVVNAWDPRYLGLVVVPALLPLAGALSQARWGTPAALLAVACLAATSVPLIVDKATTVATAKSDAAYLAQELKPQLAPGDLVISAEVTDAPAFAFYLGQGYRYATPLGSLAQPLVVDWSNLTGRLQANDAPARLRPLVARLPLGAKVVVVNPAHWGGGETPKAYATAVADQAIAADNFVAGDPQLREVRSYGVPRFSDPLYPFVANLFVRVKGRA
jgi:4-amino-4-deoxy-L-arabinose transferase-like glycosyltransferase